MQTTFVAIGALRVKTSTNGNDYCSKQELVYFVAGSIHQSSRAMTFR